MVGEALKGGRLVAQVMTQAGYACTPPQGLPQTHSFITAIELGSAAKMVAFCQAVQKCCPIGSYIQPIAGVQSTSAPFVCAHAAEDCYVNAIRDLIVFSSHLILCWSEQLVCNAMCTRPVSAGHVLLTKQLTTVCQPASCLSSCAQMWLPVVIVCTHCSPHDSSSSSDRGALCRCDAWVS